MTENESNCLTTISDKFLKRIYDSGNWSIIAFFTLVILLHFNGSFIVYSSTFTTASINFQCQSHQNSSLYMIQNNSCSMRNLKDNESVRCTGSYKFLPKDNYMSSSIISHFQLVCDRHNLAILSQSLVIWGLFIGGFIGPMVGDYFGRQKAVLCSIFLCGIFGILIAFSPNFLTLAIGKCILGILREISMTNGFVLAMELIPSNKQTLFGMLNQIIWCFSLVTIGLLAFSFRDWQNLQVVGSFPSLLAPVLIILISESPRWLISKGKMADLEKMVKFYIVKWNNVKYNEFDDLLKQLENRNELLLPGEGSREIIQYRVLDMLRSKYILLWTFIMTFTWIYCCTAIYSLNSMTTLSAGNYYLNYCISGLLDAVGVVIVFFAMGTSRNATILLFQLISSASFIAAAFLPESLKYLTTCLIILGKVALNGNVFVICLSALYIYPSSLRIFGSNISVSFGRFVAIGSPYVVELFIMNMSLTMTILGVLALMVGILNIFFPDWLNRPLPETIEDIERLKRNIFFPCCHRKLKNDHAINSSKC